MKVIEVFASIQGEGRYIGKPTCFVRMAGCNIRCRWCDTPESWDAGKEMSVSEVVEHVESSRLTHVCITGGEPLTQRSELVELISELKKRRHFILLETNGSVYDKEVFTGVDSVACDMKPPSSGEKSKEGILDKLREKDYVKVVVANDEDLHYAKQITEKSPVEVFLQPVDADRIKWLCKSVLDEKINARALPQLHKIAGVK